jgi:hypothetical protein
MSDEQHLSRAVARIWTITYVIAAAGTPGLFAWRGWKWGVGFAVGCAISGLNFHWLKQVATRLGTSDAKPRMAVLLGLRYLLLGGCSYVILKYSEISLPAFFWGLFATVAAVIIEILFELVYAQNGTVDH